jgi:hypothetical protein
MIASQLWRLMCVGGVCSMFAVDAVGQSQFIMADRTNDSMYRARDLNYDGVLSDPGEVFLFYNGANAAGSPALVNPSGQAVNVCRTVFVGDQGTGLILWMNDENNDGDAMDAGESGIFCGPGNTGGLVFSFPTGLAVDRQCRVYAANAGNASGPDAIYRLVDLNGDGDAMDNVDGVNEASMYVGPGAFGAGNGPYGPQEIFFVPFTSIGYLKNSSTGIFAIYRFEDLNNNGVADDAGEFTTFLDATNASGVPMTAGLPLEIDRWRENSMYTLQIATGGIDQLVRATDLNRDGDAQDAGEAAIVFTNPDAGFTAVDIVSLINGDVLITDNSGIRVFRLHDGNGNGNFMDAGEATVTLASGGTIAQARQMDILHRPGDVNWDGVVNVFDLLGIINDWGGPLPFCAIADVNCDGAVNVPDILAVINNWG